MIIDDIWGGVMRSFSLRSGTDVVAQIHHSIHFKETVWLIQKDGKRG